MQIKAIIFDMDGIIIDSEPLQMEAYNTLFRKYRIMFTRQYFRTLIGISSLENLRVIRQTYGLHDTAEEILKEKDDLYRQELEEWLNKDGRKAANPGIIEAIEKLVCNDMRLAVASSSPLNEIHRILGGLDILDRFHVFASGEEVARSKPAPDVFLLALERLGVEAGEAIVIEDSSPGVQAAKDAGIYCIAVPSIYTQGSDFSRADMILQGTDDLPAALSVFLQDDTALKQCHVK